MTFAPSIIPLIRRVVLVLAILSTASPAVRAQVPAAPVEGLHENKPRVHALINARLVVAPGRVIERGCLVVRDGLIADIAADLPTPADARVWDLQGKTVYAGFIDGYSHYGLAPQDRPKPLRPEKPDRAKPVPPAEPDKPAGSGSWNPLVTPQRDSARLVRGDEKAAEKLRALGFTNAFVVPGRGIFRGAGAMLDLNAKNGNRSLVRSLAPQAISLETSDQSDQYPTSLMGCVALIRQTLLDAAWYEQAQRFQAGKTAVGERPETNEALAALAETVAGRTPAIFEAEDELDLLRAIRIDDEFRLKPILRGNGYEYRVLDPLKQAGATIILPLAFPEAPEVETPEKALDITLAELEHWQEAPANPGRLAKAGVPFVLTTDGLDKPEKTFWPRLRAAVQRGLSEEAALAALTTGPAGLFGIDARYGTLEKGKVASFIVTNGDVFTDENAAVVTSWINGEYDDTDKGKETDLRGTYAVAYFSSDAKGPDTLKIEGDEPTKPKVTTGSNDAIAAAVEGERLNLLAPAKLFGGNESGLVRLTAAPGAGAEFTLEGTGQLADGRTFRWNAKRTAAFKAKEKPDKDGKDANPAAAKEIVIPAKYPAGAFGRRLDEPPPPEILLVQNATVWTAGPQGRLDNADVLVENGKISQVGQGLLAPAGARIIDAAGMHVTPGLIDCHSHTAISRGVNEGTHAVTCEVRIGDVLDATDIGIYRELAGGLTTAHVLHGSANPIGGQDQVIKLRWGGLPEDLKFAGAMPGVKFALGENVKQSNWGDRYTTRYPQTRMGVEEIFRDTFLAARDYEKSWADYRRQPADSAMPPRRDLRMEAALEILNGQRLIHIHSYRQDEILMFVRLAQELGLTVAAFHHGLEAYKVADEIAKLGAGVSTFSDWWAYKYEVIDAIPFNGAMLEKAGVVTSFNSDSNELARRLNTEAAKAVKYGGLSEEDALALVTINPARQLRIDRQTGSLEPGKDADFVLWDGHPLSAYSRAEQTWIDGRCYFDYQRDQQARREVTALREALIQKALPERQKAMKDGGDDDEKKGAKKPDGVGAEMSEIARLVLHGAIHRALEYQGLYHNGQDRHNCSNASN